MPRDSHDAPCKPNTRGTLDEFPKNGLNKPFFGNYADIKTQ